MAGDAYRERNNQMRLIEIMANWNIVMLIPVFSIAWFVVGIFAGKSLSDSKSVPKKKRSRKPDAARSGVVEMYVGNLSYDVDEKCLSSEFKKFGELVSVRIIKNRFNNKSRGFGFVEMAKRPEAMEAIRALNGKDIRGRRILVNEAKTQSRN